MSSTSIPQITSSNQVVSYRQKSGIPDVIGHENVATRLVFRNKELKFSGRPEDWPLFIQQFQETTALCCLMWIYRLGKFVTST